MFDTYKALWTARGINLGSIDVIATVYDGVQHSVKCDDPVGQPRAEPTMADVLSWHGCFDLDQLRTSGLHHTNHESNALATFTRDDILLDQELTLANAGTILMHADRYQRPVPLLNSSMSAWGLSLRDRYTQRAVDARALINSNRTAFLERWLKCEHLELTGEVKFLATFHWDANRTFKMPPREVSLLKLVYGNFGVISSRELQLISTQGWIVEDVQLEPSDKTLHDTLLGLLGTGGVYESPRDALTAARSL